MNEVLLFKPAQGEAITSATLERNLRTIGADNCDVLFIHSSINFGVPNPALGRKGLLEEIWKTLRKLDVPTLCVPTFTFSFPNGQDYDVETSPTRMGALNEFVRRLPEATRSQDPIMSVALVGKEHELVTQIGKYSCGPGCTYDLLHRRGQGVKFLFLGVRCFECFTFTHFVESEQAVPYRYHRPFSGQIMGGGKSWQDTYFHYARYNGVKATPEDKFEQYLESTGRLQKQRLGDGWISLVDEPDGYDAMRECLDQNPFYLADRVYQPFELTDRSFLEKDIVTL